MSQPQIDGYKILSLIGEGACGSVYLARKTKKSKLGEWVVIRNFNALSINRSLIENIYGRLAKGSYPKGAAPIEWVKPKTGNLCMVMPVLAELDQQTKTVTPRNLQQIILDYPRDDAWEIIEKIAHALASMHSRRIPHGNLKPSNIFFTEDQEVLLTDFATGHMPGLGVAPYTDALFYAPPEQLRTPEDYLSGKGYSWDTYAFAVIAFRLLAGSFPRCEHLFSQSSDGSSQHHLESMQTDVHQLAGSLEQCGIQGWPQTALSHRDVKRLEVLQRCLSLDPEERYADLSEVILAWKNIDAQEQRANEFSKLNQKVFSSRKSMLGAIGLAATCILVCLVLAGKLTLQKVNHTDEITALDTHITSLTEERDNAVKSESNAIVKRNSINSRMVKIREQLLALAVTNDRLLAWMLRDRNVDLPEIQKNGPDKTAADSMDRELRHFLKLTEGEDQFQPVRARIFLQLSELEIHRKNPSGGDNMLDMAISAFEKSGINDPGQSYRFARARLICLMQALDQKNADLTATLLPKTRQVIKKITPSDSIEARQVKATMEIIDGRLIQENQAAKALEHFQEALRQLQGIDKALPENLSIRSQLAQYFLQSSDLADSLQRVDDASRLRAEAINHLRWLLKKNPNFTFAKIKLAEMEIISAEADMLSGNNSAGEKKIRTAEGMLKGLNTTDTTLRGAAMQTALISGLRAVLSHDSGRSRDSLKSLDRAIKITKKIAEANPDAPEPIYRLAGFYWQSSSLAGKSGDYTTELKLGSQAASLMENLLKKGAGKRDNEVRRSLAYLYGNLGTTAARKSKASDAVSFFKKASRIWQSLIDKNGKKSEYTEGLKWSQQRAK